MFLADYTDSSSRHPDTGIKHRCYSQRDKIIGGKLTGSRIILSVICINGYPIFNGFEIVREIFRLEQLTGRMFVGRFFIKIDTLQLLTIII